MTMLKPVSREDALRLFVDVLAMTDAYDQHDLSRFLQFTDDAKIPHPIAPQAKLLIPQRFDEIARTDGSRKFAPACS
jgi:hypothetical protein